MTRQNKISFIILFVGLGFLSFVVIQKALADVSNIKFPVAELGGCTSETECRSYCDKPENAPYRAISLYCGIALFLRAVVQVTWTVKTVGTTGAVIAFKIQAWPFQQTSGIPNTRVEALKAQSHKNNKRANWASERSAKRFLEVGCVVNAGTLKSV